MASNPWDDLPVPDEAREPCPHRRRNRNTLRCADCGEVIPLPGQAGLFDGFVLFVNLPPKLHEQLQERAAHDGATLAGVTRKALTAYLRRPA